MQQPAQLRIPRELTIKITAMKHGGFRIERKMDDLEEEDCARSDVVEAIKFTGESIVECFGPLSWVRKQFAASAAAVAQPAPMQHAPVPQPPPVPQENGHVEEDDTSLPSFTQPRHQPNGLMDDLATALSRSARGRGASVVLPLAFGLLLATRSILGA
jgi:hypothetical protein